MQQAVARYRDFRAELRQLGTLDSTVLTLLKELMNLRDEGYD